MRGGIQGGDSSALLFDRVQVESKAGASRGERWGDTLGATGARPTLNTGAKSRYRPVAGRNEPGRAGPKVGREPGRYWTNQLGRAGAHDRGAPHRNTEHDTDRETDTNRGNRGRAGRQHDRGDPHPMDATRLHLHHVRTVIHIKPKRGAIL